MLGKILKSLFTVLGAATGWFLGKVISDLEFLKRVDFLSGTLSSYIIMGIFALITAFIFYILSPLFIRHTIRLVEAAEKTFTKIPPGEIILGAVGGLLALTIFYFITGRFWDRLGILGPILGIIGNVIAFFMGASIAMKKKDDIESFGQGLFRPKGSTSKGRKTEFEGIPKVLDTSVIIDGRIFDIAKTGFMEGPLIIPDFVLEELRHIADSSDPLKRNRGRRGLDVLNRIRKELDIRVIIWEKEVKDAQEVDIKLLKLAGETGGKVVTNDYNLNKVAELQGVAVLNINELANAVKPVLLPGEEMTILVSREGKEQNQGIGYLDDGTMIVIENGRRYVGSEITAVVTSVLQTAAGRMIFARPLSDSQQ